MKCDSVGDEQKSSRSKVSCPPCTYVHVLVELTTVDELEVGGDLVVGKVLLDGLLVDTGDDCAE